MCGTEGTECLSLYVFHFSGIRIILFFGLTEEPVHSIAYARGDVDIFEKCKVRQADLECVRHTVLELVKEPRLVEL